MAGVAEVVDFLAREWPILLGIVALSFGIVIALIILVRVGDSGIEAESEADPCPACGDRLMPDGVFPGGSCTERCRGCGSMRLWLVEDGKIPKPKDFSAEDWDREGHAKVHQGQVRGREWGDIGVANRSGE